MINFHIFVDGKYEDWKTMMDVNVLALGLCTQEALKTMRKRGDNGVIINISRQLKQINEVEVDIYLN